MQFIWATDKKYQRNLYAIKCKAIQSGFYQNIRSIILPYVHENDWYLPDYDLFSLPRFMQLLIESDVKYEDTETEVYKIIDNHFDLDISEKDYIKDIRSFDNVKEDLVKYVKSIFPSFEKVENIYIIPTKFGTLGSFDVRYKEEGKVDFYITHRIGFSWGNIPVWFGS
ncbi:MAG: hypothetical protein WCO33_04170 [bacterium]